MSGFCAIPQNQNKFAKHSTILELPNLYILPPNIPSYNVAPG